MSLIAGVDEVGRGPLVGPVVAAAVILPVDCDLPLNDSKKLSEKKRELLYDKIIEQAVAYSIIEVSAAVIDDINILQASMLAMKQALESLDVQPSKALVDGNRAPDVTIPCECIVKGDSKEPAIMAASILAKVYRDRLMVELDKMYPQYGFAGHKGYPTKVHLEKIAQLGVFEDYRRSFGPVRRLIEQ